MMEKKDCFIIMPISDTGGYDNGHFSRVYEHLIKPSIVKAGFNPIRADDKKNTNYIVIDILRMIIEADIVVCDLSAKNANVLYELGIRQAFNKKVLLLKDKLTDRIFDIQGLRYVEYDESLRIDSVKNDIETISTAITETYTASENEINSLIQLLSIKPATVSTSVEISNETNLLLKAIHSIEDRLNKLDYKQVIAASIQKNDGKTFKINNEEIEIGSTIFSEGKELGILIDVHPDGIFLKNKNQITKIPTSDTNFKKISMYPF